MNHLITALLVIPIVGALVVATLPKAETKLAHGVGIAFGVLEFLVSLPLATSFALGHGGMQFETNVPWIAELGVHYHVGIDGFSLWIVLLTTLLTPICCSSSQHVASWSGAAMSAIEQPAARSGRITC